MVLVIYYLERPEGDECLDVASAAWLHLPGRCFISNRHGRVRCLRRNRGELVMSSSVRSPRIFTSGGDMYASACQRFPHPDG